MLCDNLVNAYPMGFMFMDNSSTWAGDTSPGETDFENFTRISSGDNDLRVRISGVTSTISSVFSPAHISIGSVSTQTQHSPKWWKLM